MRKIISVVLLMSIIFVSLFSMPTLADVSGSGITIKDTKMYSNAGTSGHAPKGETSTFIMDVPNGSTFSVLGSKIDGDNDLWYLVEYNGVQGYLFSNKVNFSPNIDENFEKNLLNFPDTYRDKLRNLHNYNPNWTFIPNYLTMTFNDAVDNEFGGQNGKSKKAVPEDWSEIWRSTQPSSYHGGIWETVEDGWYFASREAIAYYADPRNFLTTSGIFMFAQQSYDSNTQTVDGLKTIINNTFLANGYDENTDAYINDIMDAAKESGLNPYVIAATIIAEQGSSGKSKLISGDYSEYNGQYYGYFNFFNIGVFGDPKEKLGLEYAKKQNWNTRRVSIIEGAKSYASNYVFKNQSTYYYKDWNFVSNPFYSHQYATNVKDAYNNGSLLSKGFNQNSAMTFLIPVFKSIPDEISPNPETIPIVQPIIKGDTNNDNKITLVDLANIQKHLLGIITLSGRDYTGADTDNNGNITIVDLANVQKHLLGLITLS